MTQIQMTEMLSTTLCVTADDAQAALEAKEWNLLEAAQLLQQQERARRMEAKQPQNCRSGVIRDILSWFTARHDTAAPSPTTLAPLFLMPAVYAQGISPWR